MKALIPNSPDQLSGPFLERDHTHFEILAHRDKTLLIEFFTELPGITWFDTFDLMFCQQQHNPDTIKVIRKATDEERKRFRVPLWIQGEDIPQCCGRPMHFIGQIDDNNLCTERPPDAKLWWHDAASFYLFTCSQCLECKALGQQF